MPMYVEGVVCTVCSSRKKWKFCYITYGMRCAWRKSKNNMRMENVWYRYLWFTSSMPLYKCTNMLNRLLLWIKKSGDGKSEADATQRNKERCICMNEKVFFCNEILVTFTSAKDVPNDTISSVAPKRKMSILMYNTNTHRTIKQRMRSSRTRTKNRKQENCNPLNYYHPIIYLFLGMRSQFKCLLLI